MLKKSTVFNFLYIFQLTSNFLNLVLNIHICLYKNSKILFLLEKNNFQVKISTFFFSQTPKSKAIFGIFVPSCPKSARNKVYQINLNFSKIQSAAMSVDVSLRSKKRITVHYCAHCTQQSNTLMCKMDLCSTIFKLKYSDTMSHLMKHILLKVLKMKILQMIFF